MTVALDVANAGLGGLAGLCVGVEGGEQIRQLFAIQFLLPEACPMIAFWAVFAMDRVGDVVDVHFGVATVQDLDGFGKQFGSDVPVILCSIGDYNRPFRFAKTAVGGFTPRPRNDSPEASRIPTLTSDDA